MKNIKDYTMEELMELSRAFVNEIERRRRIEKEKDWNNLVSTIRDYVKKYGGIEINCYGEGSGGFIDVNSKFDSFNEIEL